MTFDFTPTMIDTVKTFYDLIPRIFGISKSLTAIQKTVLFQQWEVRNQSGEVVEKIPPEIMQKIKQPTYQNSFDEYNDLIITDLLLAGNVFAYDIMVDNQYYKKRLKPYHVDLSGNEFDIDYRYNAPGFVDEIQPEFLTHIKHEPDPQNEVLGWGVAAKNITTIQTALSKIEFREAFYKNGCKPSGIFSLDSEAVNGLTEKLRLEKIIADEWSGSQNRSKTPILPAKVKYHQLSFNDNEEKLDLSIQAANKEIMMAFGLPRFLAEIGLEEAGQKYNNFEKQLEHYMLYTIAPILTKIEAVYNSIIKKYDENLTFVYNVPMEIYTPELLQNLVKTAVITPNQARELMDFEADPDTRLDKYYFNGSEIGSRQEAALPPQVSKSEPVKTFERKKDWRDSHGGGWCSRPSSGEWSKQELKDGFNQQQIKRDFARLSEATINKKIKENTKVLTTYLTTCYGQILLGLKENIGMFEKAEDETNKIVDWKEQDKIIDGVFVRMYNSVGAATFENVEQTLTITLPYKGQADPKTAAAINLMRANGPLVNQTTREQMQGIIKQSLNDGLNVTETAKKIMDNFVDENYKITPEFKKIFRVDGTRADFDKVMSGASKSAKLTNRALLIARNEIALAQTEMSKIALQESGVVKGVQIIGCSQEGDINSNTDCVPIENMDELILKHIQCSGVVVPCAYVD